MINIRQQSQANSMRASFYSFLEQNGMVVALDEFGEVVLMQERDNGEGVVIAIVDAPYATEISAPDED